MRTETQWQDRERELLQANVALREELRVMKFGKAEERMAEWIRSRIGNYSMATRERAMRVLEEAVELAQAEGIGQETVIRQVDHVYARPAGEPRQEAAGAAVCLLGWCAAANERLIAIALAEMERIEKKPLDKIRGSLARKAADGLLLNGSETGSAAR